MYACLFADAAVEKVSTRWLHSHEALLRRKCVAYDDENGHPPHPGVLIEMITLELKQKPK
jgi:hypothetical protein